MRVEARSEGEGFVSSTSADGPDAASVLGAYRHLLPNR
jgi:hypothetical protein